MPGMRGFFCDTSQTHWRAAACEKPQPRAAGHIFSQNQKKESVVTPEAAESFQHVANNVLMWIGFGMLAGMVAKAIMPGRDPGGPIATLLMGCGGSVVGSGALMYFWEGQRVPAISPLGFAVATGGAFVILFFYRLLSGRIIREDGEGYGSINRVGQPNYRRRRSRRSVHEE